MLRGNDLLDTNAAIAWLIGIGGLPNRYLGRDLVVSVVTIGELRFGADKSTDRNANHQAVDRLVKGVEVCSVDLEIAAQYGSLKQILRSAGTPIPDNDLWIAATALAEGLTLVTRDKHFDAVPALRLATW